MGSPNSDDDSASKCNPLDGITSNTPLRLEVAARLAFPDGSMKLAGLRREVARGRLAYEVIAGKHYTTLADIDAMRQLCRVPIMDRASTRALRAATNAPLGTDGMSPQERLQIRLNRSLQSRDRKKS